MGVNQMTEPKNRRIFVTATGAGAGAQNRIWSVPGCSKYFAGAAFPYAADQTNELLGFKPDKYVSEDTALDLAMASYMRACNGPGCEAIGIGLTASVASTERHRGEHEIWAACVSNYQTFTHHSVLKKGKGDEARKRDGNKSDRIILDMIRFATCKSMELEILGRADMAADRFFYKPFFEVDGKRYHGMLYPNPGPIYPGAYNPVHKAHIANAEAASHLTIFSITQDGPNKPPLTLADMLQRAKMFKGKRVLFSRGDPLYIDKARAKPGTPIVIGSDALQRMLDPKWGPDVKEMLYEFVSLYTTFLVAPRIINGAVLSMDNVLDSAGIDFQVRSDLFRALEVEPSDISSSQIRSQQ
jgi:nicotinic acid mononucleotide adenylyltransferase/nicotinamide mononucleotide (NMN) deamidase PncC